MIHIKIDFENGSSITTIETTLKQEKDFSVIGVDVSNGEDYSCVVCKCGKCNTMINIGYFKPNEDIYLPVIKECTNCGVEFKCSYIANT